MHTQSFLPSEHRHCWCSYFYGSSATLASASILLSKGEVSLSMGAFLLAFINMVAIQFSASVICG